MTGKEKRNILILLVVSVIFIVGLKIFAKQNETPQDEQVSAGGKGEVITVIGQQNTTTDPKEEIDEYVQVLEDGSKLNISDEVAKTKTLDGLEISNIQLKEKEKGKMTTLLAEVENKTTRRTTEKKIKVEILDKEGKVITSAMGFIDPIEIGKKVKLNVSILGDASNAYDIRISNFK